MNELKPEKDMPIVPAAEAESVMRIGGYKIDNCAEKHVTQLVAFSDQLSQYFQTQEDIYVSNKGLIQYLEEYMKTFISPKVTTVFGINIPPLEIMATMHLGSVAMAVVDFPCDPPDEMQIQKTIYEHLIEMSFQEYFIHQADMQFLPDFRGWKRDSSGEIVEMLPDAQGRLLSKALNVWLRWEEQPEEEIRLLRAYLPDGTVIPTSSEEEELSLRADAMATAAAEAVERMQLIRVEAGYQRI